MKSPKLLYVSSLCGPGMQKYLWETSIIKPRQAVQKFHRLLSEGFAMHVPEGVDVLSSIPITSLSHARRWWRSSTEQAGGIRYRYLTFINLPYIKNIFIFLLSMMSTLRWILTHKAHQQYVICDGLILSVTAGCMVSAKLMKQKVAVIVTDLPGLLIDNNQMTGGLNERLHKQLVSYILTHFDYYIILTRQMNEVVNPRKKPFIVMEGLVDDKGNQLENTFEEKGRERIIIYAGGIYEEYGIKTLIKAFMQLKDETVRLHIYGKGDMENDMPKYLALDSRINYFGLVPNDVVVKRLTEATLLINPRPTKEEFVKYSFPSKNMDYMASGTPLLTTALPGMPEDYYDYVYLLKDESIEGFRICLETLLDKHSSELYKFGVKAKKFVLSNKNNRLQTKRILDLIVK
ncbi:MAG: glycosyltransferase [Bacteroidota bacterium]|nr:glycosyltransferase [Bacteroidota bacterium]